MFDMKCARKTLGAIFMVQIRIIDERDVEQEQELAAVNGKTEL